METSTLIEMSCRKEAEDNNRSSNLEESPFVCVHIPLNIEKVHRPIFLFLFLPLEVIGKHSLEFPRSSS